MSESREFTKSEAIADGLEFISMLTLSTGAPDPGVTAATISIFTTSDGTRSYAVQDAAMTEDSNEQWYYIWQPSGGPSLLTGSYIVEFKLTKSGTDYLLYDEFVLTSTTNNDTWFSGYQGRDRFKHIAPSKNWP